VIVNGKKTSFAAGKGIDEGSLCFGITIEQSGIKKRALIGTNGNSLAFKR